MLRSAANRFRRHKGKEREDWMWYEDPYKTKSDLSADGHDGMIGGHIGSVPAPNPMFGTEPPVRTAFGSA